MLFSTSTSNNASFLARLDGKGQVEWAVQPKGDAVVYDTAGPIATGPNGNVVAYFWGNKRDMTGAPALFEYDTQGKIVQTQPAAEPRQMTRVGDGYIAARDCADPESQGLPRPCIVATDEDLSAQWYALYHSQRR